MGIFPNMATSDSPDTIQERYRPYHGEETSSNYTLAEKAVNALWKGIAFLKEGVMQEKSQTQQMGHTFFRLLADKLQLDKRTEPPTPEEVREAMQQLKDVGKLSFFISFSLLPGGGALLITLELLARRMGITWFSFVPSSFRPPDEDATAP